MKACSQLWKAVVSADFYLTADTCFSFPSGKQGQVLKRKQLKVCEKVVWRTEAKSSRQRWVQQNIACLSREAEHKRQINFSSTGTRNMTLTHCGSTSELLSQAVPACFWQVCCQPFTLFLSVWWLQNISCGTDQRNQSGWFRWSDKLWLSLLIWMFSLFVPNPA